MIPPIEITALTKIGGPLTKRITLLPDGSLHSDGSACVMSRGSAKRARFDNLESFAEHIGALASHEAIALGALRHGIPENVQIDTKKNLKEINGSAALDLIARTGDHIIYRPGQPALALLDYDTKGMPTAVADRIKAAGSFWSALVSVLPDLETAGRVERRSTSAGIHRDIPALLAGETDKATISRFLRRWTRRIEYMRVVAAGNVRRDLDGRPTGEPSRAERESANEWLAARGAT